MPKDRGPLRDTSRRDERDQTSARRSDERPKSHQRHPRISHPKPSHSDRNRERYSDFQPSNQASNQWSAYPNESAHYGAPYQAINRRDTYWNESDPNIYPDYSRRDTHFNNHASREREDVTRVYSSRDGDDRRLNPEASSSRSAAPSARSRSHRSLLPDGWLDYTNSGRLIEGTRIMCLKTPVDALSLYRQSPASVKFRTEDFFLEMQRLNVKIGMLVDLTFTKKYYQGPALATKRGVKYVKIAVPGQAVPPEAHYVQFRDELDHFLANAPGDENVAVHCTHGVNRTGWFVCRYIMERFGSSFENARRKFAAARGHDIHREYLIKDLQDRECQSLLAAARSSVKPLLPVSV